MIVPPHRVVRCCPKTHPCPKCGQRGRRKRTLHRRIRSLAYRQEGWIDVYYAEYKARCRCCKYFRSWPLDVPAKSDYDEKVREAVLDRILEDGLNVQRTLESMRRDFGLKLSQGFVYDCLRWRIKQQDMAPHRQMVLEKFSGTLCVDERYKEIPELKEAMEALETGKFKKMVAFTHGEAGKKVRTNNHVERTNRKLRFAEKVRYKWRRRKWVLRYVLLALDRWWRQAAKAAKQAEPDKKDLQRPTGP